MKIIIIGASGLVGSHCMDLFESVGEEVVGTHLNFATERTIYFNPLSNSNGNLDLDQFKPEVIIHCAALTNVDYCENNVLESERATVLSTKKLVNYCKKNGVKLVYISTDYVFDGNMGPYTEDAATNPINIYGQHKLKAELLVKTLNNYLIARITNVYGEEVRSKNFVLRLIKLFQNNEETELNLPADQFATPVYAGDVARMLYKLILDNKNGIYNLSSSDYYTRYSLAKRVKSYFPDNEKIVLKSVLTNKLNQPARRPLNGGLLNIKFLNEYNDFKLSNVDDFISKMIKYEL
ncbi:dTDP-4-dehydrorhamnose reductase [Mucilaginibacter frigoritolerans]|jgi:dTDP-4-dehydrorhamnose reductase|uniref:dTDP-4-dehydrorhamnose reductase n=1 Tax=Mucilaginibacter frigoritolerans TaxID=652788 RepID=A0A562TJS4_9SPHI|nr:SDR family oxidoreductase [Mucilaginibacter frigoritolerans]TWI93809.1 dTDP-4-dehydrorhamnose reductase [Mucilaginibacter frigoritolerans]